MIRILDGGIFSHAALFVGSGHVAEAIGEGLRNVSLDVSLGSAPGDWIAVLRRQPIELASNLQPVIGVANAYVASGTRYAYHDVFFCAAMALSRRIPLSPGRRALIRRVLDLAAGLLVDAATRGRPLRLMCSEFVYRCFLEAKAERPGELRLAIAGLGPSADEADPPLIAPAGARPGSILDLARNNWPPPEDASAEAPALYQNGATEDRSLSFAALEEIVAACEEESIDEAVVPAGLDADLLRSVQRLAKAVQTVNALPGEEGISEVLTGAPRLDDLEKWLGHFVSPKDLAESPTLDQVGRLAAVTPPEAG